MAWYIITQRNLNTGESTRRFCWQGEPKENYVELTEEQVNSLLEGIALLNGVLDGEDYAEEAPQQELLMSTGPETVVNTQKDVTPLPVSNPPEELSGDRFSLKSLMAASNGGPIDEDGISQG